MPGLPHHGRPAACRHFIEQGTARLHIGNHRRPRCSLEQIAGIDHQKLIAPDHPALPVHRANPVAIAIKSDPEIKALVRHQRLEVSQIGFDRRIGVVVGEIAIHFGIKQMVFARQARGQLFQRRPGGPIASIPADPQRGQFAFGNSVKPGQQAVDIGVHDIASFHAAVTINPFASSRYLAQPDDIRTKKRAVLKHHLEAVVIGGVMAARDLDRAIDIVRRSRCVIEHRGGRKPDPHHVAPARLQAFDQRMF